MKRKHIFSRIVLGPPAGLRSDESAWIRGRARVRETGLALPFALRVTRYGESVLFPEDAGLPLDFPRDEAEAELIRLLGPTAQDTRESLIDPPGGEPEEDTEGDEDEDEDEDEAGDEAACDWGEGLMEDDE
ncbi:MAG: hypothetical protein MR009_07845 [Sutterellaceae bacterium]|nr:hypothetical protein [Sutterellaceae bacterium]MDD7441339.1 hypothetical protein [Sutterellaceae bacterium]MDY2868716.1 hypothetical protein [Mesosutterella sp.]